MNYHTTMEEELKMTPQIYDNMMGRQEEEEEEEKEQTKHFLFYLVWYGLS